jgi:hypothetical protein
MKNKTNMTDVISIKDFRKEKEKRRWANMLQELEEKADEAASEGLTPEEQVGYEKYKRFLNKMREHHVLGYPGKDQDGKV